MKQISLLIVFLILSFFAKAQINAVTSEGDEVMLYTNGTWEYVNPPLEEEYEIRTNPEAFVRDGSSSFLVKSRKFNLGVWINPKKWSFEKKEDEGAAEYTFQKRGEDIYAMLITERVAIPIPSLRQIALDNAREAAPDIRLIDEEYRTVNGKQMLMMQLAGTIQGLEFIYYGYYFSNTNGTVQFVAYSGMSLFEEYKNDMETILNGMVEME